MKTILSAQHAVGDSTTWRLSTVRRRIPGNGLKRARKWTRLLWC